MRELFPCVLALLALFCTLAHATQYHAYVRKTPQTTTNVTDAVGGLSIASTESDAGIAFLINGTSLNDVVEQIQIALAEASGDPQVKRDLEGPMNSIFVNAVLPVRGTAVTASWALDRVDQTSNTLDSQFTISGTGAGVTINIVDTGVNIAHSEFASGRATAPFSAYQPNSDLNGHGTHVASCAAGVTRGLAKGASIRSIKVLNAAGSGTTFTVAQGLLYVMNNPPGGGRQVVSMSLAYTVRDVTLEAIFADMSAMGIVLVAAAGNSNVNTCNTFPAAHANVIAVGAVDITTTRSVFSNFGEQCTDIFAPGTSISGASAATSNGFVFMSGTSMATPFVSGMCAVILQQNPGATVTQVYTILRNRALINAIANAQTSPNYLLNVNVAASATRTPTGTRTASPSPTTTRSLSSTPSLSSTSSATPSSSASISRSPSASATPSASLTHGATPSRTATRTATGTRTPTRTSTRTRTGTRTQTRTPSGTRTPTRPPSATRTPTRSPSASRSPSRGAGQAGVEGLDVGSQASGAWRMCALSIGALFVAVLAFFA